MISELSGVERALFGPAADRARIDSWLEQHVARRTGSGVAEVLFAAGRVAAVYGLLLTDGRTVVAKLHRDPVPVDGLRAAQEIQRDLHAAGYPCPEPIDGPESTGGHVATLETLLPPGRPGDGRDHRTRAASAAGLARQVALLTPTPSAASRLTPPAWARWRQGPWPTPHDPIFDFRQRIPRWAWIDEFAARAAATLHHLERDLGDPVVAHGDWSFVNTTYTPDRAAVESSYDWDSLAHDREAILAGMAAGSHLQGGTTPPPACPAPAEIDAYLDDYAGARARPFTSSERRAGHAAAHWVLAYNARCEAALLTEDQEAQEGSTLHVLLHHRSRYRDE